MSKPLPHLPPQFAKLAALYRSSTFDGERDTARRKAEAMLPPEAGDFDRALRIQAYHEAMEKGRGNMFAGFDEFLEIDDPGYMARQAAERAEKRRQQDARRAELVAEFGTLEAVLEPCWREKALLAAVKPWRKAQPRPHQRWTQSLAGLGHNDERSAPPDLIAAIEAAFPMPATYAAAVAEMAYWNRRNDDMELAVCTDFRGDDMLDTPCAWRLQFVRALAEHRMELRTVAEIAERMRAYRWNEGGEDTDVEDAILRDLDALASQEAISPAPEPAPTAPIRPAMDTSIRDVLTADPSRSDRAIAREAGCSPTTVGRMRGQMGLSGAARSVRRGGQIYGMKARPGSDAA